MSVALMGDVWRAAAMGLITDRLDLLTLLALADRCDDHGETVKHSTVKELAAKSLCDKRSMVRVIKRLEERGLLEVVRSGGGRPRSDLAYNEPRGNTYRLIVSRLSSDAQGAAVCRAEGPAGSRAADGAKALGRRNKVEGSATCGADDARGVSHSVPMVGDEMVSSCHRFSFGEKGEKGDGKRVTRVTGGLRKKEPLEALHSAEGVSAGAPRGGGVSDRARRFSDMQAIRGLWHRQGLGPMGPADVEGMEQGARSAAWMRRVGPLLDRMGREGLEEGVVAWIEAHEGDEGTSLWDVVGGMLSEALRSAKSTGENIGLTASQSENLLL